MATEKILLIGSGALARDFVESFGRDAFVAIYVDPQFPVTQIDGLPVFTDWKEARDRASHYVIGFSDIEQRERVRGHAKSAGLLPASPFISRFAVIASDASLSPGCAVGHFAVVGPSARLCEDVLVMHSAVIAHDASVGVNTLLCAGARLGGYVQIGSGCFVGPNAVVSPRVKIGSNSHIAGGASCFRDAEAYSVLIGNPARQAKRSRL